MLFSSQPKAAVQKKLRRIIYVEGKDDAYFIDALLEELEADPQDVGIVFLEGDGELEKEIDLLLKSGAYVQRATRDLAFFLDADANAEVRIAAVNATFAKRDLPTPGHGEIAVFDSDRRIGLYVFPNGTAAGELEDLLLNTVAGDDRLITVSGALGAVEATHGALTKRTKRIARMYISVLPIKPCGVGRAYREGVFEKTHADVTAVREFLTSFLA